jgi:LPXTG-site transpeptidase (sortase) family protein
MTFIKKQLRRKYFFVFLAIFGIILIIFGEGYLYYSRRILSFTTNPYKNQLQQRNLNVFPRRLIIKSIGIDLGVDEGTIVDGVWAISPNKITHLINSSVPGENSNIVLYGHNTRSILGNLSVIKNDDQIEIITRDNKIYKYKVYKIQWVNQTNVSVVEPTSYPELTIYTCTGFLDQYRLVVKASPLG